MASTETQNNEASPKNTTNSFASEFKTLRSLCIDNIEYFKRSKSQYKDRYFTVLCVIMQTADSMEPLLEGFQRIVHHFDFDDKTPGNGYRSLLHVVHCCVNKLIENCKYVKDYRNGFLFRAGMYCIEIENYSNVFGQLKLLLYHAQRLLGASKPGELFPDEELFPNMDLLLVEAEALYRECFYGRCLGFQYHDSMQQALSVISVAMASFSETFNKHEGGFVRFASSLMSSGKYVMDPRLRAEQIVKVTRNADIKFCKEFWSISDGDVMQAIPNFMCPTLQVNKLIQIQPHCFEVPTADGEDTRTITPPSAHTGPGPAFIRLLSVTQREGVLMADTIPGQDPSKPPPTPPPDAKKVAPLSKGLIIHIHGGGFVAQSSKSHEMYLRYWAKELDVPIVSMDYSHAPEQPFPRAFEECFFAYSWIVRNSHALGSTGRYICLVGDSAGGNLAMAVAMRAANYGIRIPTGIATFYAPFQVRYAPSPSRILSLMDPLLPLGVLSCCLASYAGMKEEMVPVTVKQYTVQKPGESPSPQDGSQDSGIVDGASTGPSSPPNEDNAEDDKQKQNGDQPISTQDVNIEDDNQADGSPIMEEISLNDESAEQKAPTQNGEVTEKKEKDSKPQPLFFNSPSQLYQNSGSAAASLPVAPPIRKYKNIPIVNNPYVSPLVATDELLKGLPPTYIIACHLDPILDDSIMFSRRLKKAGVNVEVKIVSDLPHGFLNFSAVSKGAYESMLECLKLVKEGMYGKGYEEWDQSEVGCQTDPKELSAMYKVDRAKSAANGEGTAEPSGPDGTGQPTSGQEEGTQVNARPAVEGEASESQEGQAQTADTSAQQQEVTSSQQQEVTSQSAPPQGTASGETAGPKDTGTTVETAAEVHASPAEDEQQSQAASDAAGAEADKTQVTEEDTVKAETTQPTEVDQTEKSDDVESTETQPTVAKETDGTPEKEPVEGAVADQQAEGGDGDAKASDEDKPESEQNERQENAEASDDGNEGDNQQRESQEATTEESEQSVYL
ncbi:hormone-sensitive lipase-like [Ptychodera flava]|uniref:hormone-sensitive lipase-like n=1 Tax=Ptychodera flava TaxID=63121 RepID=UPI003969F41A